MINDEVDKIISNLCRNNCYSDWEKNFLYELAATGLSCEQLEYVSQNSRTILEMKEIAEGFLKGMSAEQVAVYASKDFNAKEMRLLKEGLLSGRSIENMKLYGRQLINLRKSMYDCVMMQFETAIAQFEKETGVPFSGSVKAKAFREAQLYAASLETKIPALIEEEAGSFVYETLNKNVSKDLDALISKAGEKLVKNNKQQDVRQSSSPGKDIII